jgi:nucleotide-binding universal stress UspA family protein
MNYRHIIIPLDGSELAECVIPHLEALASNCQVTTVELVRAVPPIELHYKEVIPFDERQEKQLNQAAIREAEEYLEQVKSRLDSSRMAVTIKVLPGRVRETLVHYLEKSDADLLLIASHGRSGPSRWYWGSVADRLLRCSRIPAFLIRPPAIVSAN